MKSITFAATALAVIATPNVYAQTVPDSINLSSLQAAASDAGQSISSMLQNPSMSSALAAASSAFDSYTNKIANPTNAPGKNSGSSLKPATAVALALSAAAAVGML
ncbi:hypothetical protein BJ944DRAFT_260009 [Cunninghamella echinulata]|nr:hypothetical protein BJ944DRAFT_260009 [Cunninghamella echinulata]